MPLIRRNAAHGVASACEMATAVWLVMIIIEYSCHLWPQRIGLWHSRPHLSLPRPHPSLSWPGYIGPSALFAGLAASSS